MRAEGLAERLAEKFQAPDLAKHTDEVRLSLLFSVWENLHSLLRDESAIVEFIREPCPCFNEQSALDLMRDGRTAEVVEYLEHINGR